MKPIVNELQQLSENQFKKLIDNLPTIEVELVWDEDGGKKENDCHQIEIDDFLIACELSVYESGTTTSATYHNPAEYNMEHRSVHVQSIEIWHNDNQVELTTDQEQKLLHTIIQNVVGI